MKTKTKSPKKSTRAKSSSSRSRAVPRASSRRRIRAVVPAAPKPAPTFEADGKQRLFDGEKPRERAPMEPGDEHVTVQTLRVTRREVRRWNAAAEKSKQQNGRPWETLHAMTWARKVLNRAADELLGSAL